LKGQSPQPTNNRKWADLSNQISEQCWIKTFKEEEAIWTNFLPHKLSTMCSTDIIRVALIPFLSRKNAIK
jgi:hypothetical protein